MLQESDFSTFKKYLDSSGKTFEELLGDLRSKSPDGRGGNAVFYKIPGTEFGVRDEVRGKKEETSASLEPVDDPFEGENVGQAVAKYGENVKVLRLQKGKPLGVPLGFDKYESDELEDAAQTLKDRILDAAALPVEAYAKLMNRILKLNEKGFAMDPSKSGNLLVDPGSGFGLVDIGPKGREDYFNSATEILEMITDNFNYTNFSKWIEGWNDQELKKAGQDIRNKIERAANMTGFPTSHDKGPMRQSVMTDPDFKPELESRPKIDWDSVWKKKYSPNWAGSTVALPNRQTTKIGSDGYLIKPRNFGEDGKPIKG